MRPSLIYEKLSSNAGLLSMSVDGDRIHESQSLDERPHQTGLFITVSFEEAVWNTAVKTGPVNITVAAHIPWADGRDYTDIHRALNFIQEQFVEIENEIGTDDVLVSQAQPTGRSANLSDEGWQTITKTATYRVSYRESLA